MIEFKPDISGNIIRYTAVSGNDNIGSIVLELEGTRCRITEIRADGSLTAEGLIRSALNAAGRRNAFTCSYIAEEYSSVAADLGFESTDYGLCGEIPFLLGGCACEANRQFLTR